MKTIHFCKRLHALAAAAVVSMTAMVVAPVADAAQTGSLLVLGDSISAGYGLKGGELGYYDHVADYMGYTTTNLAVSGAKTSDLLALLEQSATQTAVADADLICISIGGNDLLAPAQSYLQQLMQPDEDIKTLFQRLYNEGTAFQELANLTGVLRPHVETAQANLQTIASTLRELNPDASIVMQSLYNMVEYSSTEYGGVDYSDAYSKLSGFVKGQCRKINTTIAALDSVTYADVAAGFADTGWIYIRVREKDIHPTRLGHALIAATVLDALGVQSGKSPAIWGVLDTLSAEDAKVLPANDRALLEQYAGARASAEESRGDVNGDGRVDADDATAALLYYTQTLVGGKTTLTAEQLLRADVVKDGVVNAADATIILQYYVISITGQIPVWEELIG